MKNTIRFKLQLVLILSLAFFFSCKEKEGRLDIRKQSFDQGWSFIHADIDVKNVFGADQSNWQSVDLPHDWSVEMPFKKSKNGIPVGHTQGGIGWYTKKFDLPLDMQGKCLQVYFEGVYMNAEVWINGVQVGNQPYGYTSFFCDITDFCSTDHPNTIAVKVKNEGQNTRWYAGSGIYRHVWLITTDKIHLDEWGTFITSDQEGTDANVNLAIDVYNKYDEPKNANLIITLFDQSEKIVGTSQVSVVLDGNSKETVTQSIKVLDPTLWSTDFPEMYKAQVELNTIDNQKDLLEVPFGIRYISFSAKDGFLLNGKPLKMKGVCVHHDNGLLGAVSLDRAEERKVELLKRDGFNAVRCAHNPPSEKFLEACDRLGLLVINEAFDQWKKGKNPEDYHLDFDEWHEKDLATMVLRDRNHPSIVMWSIGNEIIERSDASGVRIAEELKNIVKKYDSTRPVTAAINDYWDNPNLTWKDSPAAFTHLDVGGYNYMWWEYENDSKKFPERVIYGSETTAVERTVNWDLVEKHSNIIGDFVWTAIDYLGESGIGHAINVKNGEKDPPQFLDWPWFNAWCGDIDICGNKKPQGALRDVLWNESKIEMLVHHPIPSGYKEKVSYWGWPNEDASWNWTGHEGEVLKVKVYTRYPSVRLYLNGELIAEKETEKKDRLLKYSALFDVKYQSGELKAVAVEDGVEKDSFTLQTASEPVEVRLVADRTNIENNPNSLVYVQMDLIDKDGNIVPDKDITLDLMISGTGKILAAGNADPTDMGSFRSLNPKSYKGRALAILQPTAKGKIDFVVQGKGMNENKISIHVK